MSMRLPQSIQDVRRVDTSIVAYLSGDDLESFGKCSKDKLLLSRDLKSLLAEVGGEIHL